MKEFKFKKIDAFATVNSMGNPAGYISLDSFSDITDKEMLQIAKELKGFVNEVGYIVKTSADEFELKYYSAEREVDFCGHATIAIMYDLLKNDIDLQQFDSLKIKTNRGVLTVENKIKEQDAVFIQAPEPFEKALLPDSKDIAKNLKIEINEIDPDFSVSIINAGLTTLLVPIKTQVSILNIFPDIDELKEFCIKSEIDIIEVFTKDVSNKSNNFRTRVFAPTFGYLEDPATGSGNSAFGNYLLGCKLWETETIIIEQNSFKDQYNIVKLQKQTDGKGDIRVFFGGGAVTRMEGKYIIQ
ncbi:PhzF family phenazine biosynthesis protein [Dysgonomonas alginatilytica]|uniref:PhzF family phenazine biosynthesis protein n=1 Tax=Dysgonomonas alginatilytica TaxID=1605892 RepID=A0A2V3PV62_9BACT|nr:PhzF family phenazine biosynthesis protein [Dysgonomonas alginatilytica]PXV68796.1 PhzF family phenazine biosynthesis protein [Dysgonomonas alginatilytica]